MIEPRRAVIVYDGLPVRSGGAHHLRTRDPHEALRQLLGFLDSCCHVQTFAATLQLIECSETEPSRLLSKVRLPHYKPERAVASEASRLFGVSSMHGFPALPDGARRSLRCWALDRERLDEAVAFQLAHDIPAVGGLATLVVAVRTQFQLLNPVLRAPLPYQNSTHYLDFQGPVWGALLGQSGFHLRLHSHPTCGIVLSLPYEDLTPDCLALVGQLQSHLPFPLSSKHWTRWQLNKARTGYYSRKLTLP